MGVQLDGRTAAGDKTAASSKATPEGTVVLPDDALIILPVRRMVLFPGMILPVALGREGPIAAAQAAAKAKRPIGVLLQRDAETGKPYWTHEIKGEVWASPLVADGKVYLGTRSGDFWVFAASKEKRVLSSVELGNPVSATATAANGVLYVATMTELYAVRKSRN